MKIPILVLRPEPGNAATLAAARAAGLEALGFPLFEITATSWQAPAPDDIDALLLGSANALRHGGAHLAPFAGKPAYAVGAATAEAARAAGLEVVAEGRGGLQPLLDHIRPEHRRLLRLAGEERVKLSPPPGIGIVERIVYASRPLPMSEALAHLLTGRDRRRFVALLHSAEAARQFAGECDRLGIERARIACACIGPRVAGAAGEGWASLHSAATPDDPALLALAGQLCQNAAVSRKD